MGCPTEVEIGNNLVFTITTHDPDTGVLTDADLLPIYQVYEDETATPIISGVMPLLNSGGTTGFYSKSLTCTSGNGYENGKTYSVYIEATVDSDTGGASYGFKAYDVRKSDLTQIGTDAQSATDLKDFADDGYDPSTNKVQGVVLVDTTTVNTDITGVARESSISLMSGVVNAIDTGVDAIEAKLPSNYIMGSSDQTDKDDDIESIQTSVEYTSGIVGQLNITELGNIGIDWANVENPTTQLDLSATSIDLVDTVTTNTDSAAKLISLSGVVDRIEVDTIDIQSRIPSALVGGRIDSDIGAISTDVTAANNLELQYDGTGISGENFPSTQLQVGGIGSGSGALNKHCVIAPVVSDGDETGDETDTQLQDDSYHQVAVATAETTIDVYYEFTLGGDESPIEAFFNGRYHEDNNDKVPVVVYAYDWGNTAFEIIGNFLGKKNSATKDDRDNVFKLLSRHVGASGDLGKVRIRFYVTGRDPAENAELFVDQLLIAYTNTSRTVGYANGSIWIDTINGSAGSVRYVNGTADNPCLTMADANTLSTSTGLNRFYVMSGSSLLFAQSQEGQQFEGCNWNLGLGNQSITGTIINCANVSGVCTGEDTPSFKECDIGVITIPPSHLHWCGITGPLTFGSAGDFCFDRCHSMVPGTDTPTLDYGSGLDASNVNMRMWSGGWEVENMGAGSGSYNMSLEGFGQLVINANCSETSTIAMRGHFTVTDNAGGAVTLSNEAVFDHNTKIDSISGLVTSSHITTDALVSGLNDPTAVEIREEIDSNSTQIKSITDKLPSKDYLTGTNNTDGDLEMNETTGDFSGVVSTVTDVTNRVTANTDQIEGADPTDTIRDSILDDATRFSGANVDAAISSASSLSAAETSGLVNDALEYYKLDKLVAVAENDDPVDDSIMAKIASTGGDWSTFNEATESLQAIRDRGDSAWTGSGSGTAALTQILNVHPLIPNSIDLANTATVRLALGLTNAVDDLPSTAEITPGTISIDRKAIGGTSWSNIENDSACSEAAGIIYFDEVFNSGTGYAENDSIRVTFKNQDVTVDGDVLEVTGSDGFIYQTHIRATMRGTNSGATATALNSLSGQVDTVVDKLPTNYIMGSDDQLAHNHVITVEPSIPYPIKLDSSIAYTLSLNIKDQLGDQPSSAQITPGDIYIYKSSGGESWQLILYSATSSGNGKISINEVFDTAAGYAEGDAIRISFTSAKVTINGKDYEICTDATLDYYTYIAETERGTNSGATATALSSLSGVVDSIQTVTDAIPNSGAMTDIDTGVNNLETRLTSARGGYLDNLDISEDVAGISDVSGFSMTESGVADAVWNEAKTDHTASGSFGEEVQAHALTTDLATAINAAIVTYGLDHIVAEEVVGADVADNSIVAKMVSKSATADWDSYVNTTDSLQAIADTQGGGGSLTDVLNVQALVPYSIDLANTATVRLALGLTNMIGDLPSTSQITPGTVSIDRKAIGGTSWTSTLNAGNCSEASGIVYYDEVFDRVTGYRSGDSIRVTFKNQRIVVSATNYDITGDDGWVFQTHIRERVNAPVAKFNT